MDEKTTPLDALLASGANFADVPQVAEILKMDERTVRAAINAGDVPGVRVGQRYRVPVSWLRRAAAGETAA